MILTAALVGMLLVAQEPVPVLNAEKTWAGGDLLWPLAASENPGIRMAALKAIGRLEDPANVRPLLAMGKQGGMGVAGAAAAIAQSLNGFDPSRDPELIAAVLSWLESVTFIDLPQQKTVMPGPIGRIQWGTPEQVHAAEHALLRILTRFQYSKRDAFHYLSAVRSLESLARLNARVTPFEPDTVTRLSRIVAGTGANDEEEMREAALGALIASRGLDADTELAALKDSYAQVRRLATAVLGGAGAGLEEESRQAAIQEKLTDSDGQVRYEAVRAYARRNAQARGCDPLLDLINDRDSHVQLAVLDALGDVCKEDGDVTTRVLAEARTPGTTNWHRETHAFVALAKRAPEQAAMSMDAFVSHPSPWVRMYAARAAAAAEDVGRLDKLAYDTNDNVREAALGPLRRLKKAGADPAIIAALDRMDVQLLRTAATLLKDSAPSPRTAGAIVAALLRLTKEAKETSRDARVALLETLAVHAGPGHAQDLQPMLADFDPVVAAKTASLITQLTGKTATADPVRIYRGWPQQFANLQQCVRIEMASGKGFTLRMDTSAPVTVDRFLKLALTDRYYDGLTIHRVVPNFVIQGGSPGANEYSGHKEYMRDEIGLRNSRGTVGLSTRGRNTADAQFYINLVDNSRLDQNYTVFANVISDDMPAVNAIEEGDVMRRISSVRCPVKR